QVISLLLMVVLVWLLAERRFRMLPLLFLLWANLHGGVALGGLVLVAVLVLAAVWERPLARTLAIATGLRGIATLLTPLGPRVIGLVLGNTNEVDITEWRPAWNTMPAG